MPKPHAVKLSCMNLSYFDSRLLAPRPALLANGAPNVAVVVHRTVGGRLGHALLDIVAGMAIAGIYNWSFVPPGRDHLDVWRLFDFRGLAPELAHGDSESPLVRRWARAGCCPANWRSAYLKQTHWTGVAAWTTIDEYVRSKVPRDAFDAAASPGVCVEVALSFRVMLHHVRAWEARGHIRPGVYAAVTRALRQSFLPPRASAPAASASESAVPPADAATTVAVHARRSDPVRHAMSASNDVKTGKSTAAVAATLAHLAASLSSDGSGGRQPSDAAAAPGMHRRMDAVVFTETAPPKGAAAAAPDENDVWAHGCPAQMGSAARSDGVGGGGSRSGGGGSSCRVASGNLHDDLYGMVTARATRSAQVPAPSVQH